MSLKVCFQGLPGSVRITWDAVENTDSQSLLCSYSMRISESELCLLHFKQTPHSFYFFLGGGPFRAAPAAYGGSQARGWIRAIAAGLHHSCSSTGSELCLCPIPQLMAMLDPWLAEQGQGSNLHPHGYQSDSFPLSNDGNSPQPHPNSFAHLKRGNSGHRKMILKH